jgi:uncharacterized protein YciI
MRFIVLLEDDPAHADVRPRLMPQHLDFLKQNAAEILEAGPLSEAGTPAGGIWIVETERPERVKQLVEADPFWPAGLRKSVRTLAWRRVFAGGEALD